MDVILVLEKNIADIFQSGLQLDAKDTELLAVLARWEASIHPMHPGIDDELLSQYFSVESASKTNEDFLRELRGVPGVQGVYVKPHAEMP